MNCQDERLSDIAWIQAVGVVLVVFGHSMNGIEKLHKGLGLYFSYVFVLSGFAYLFAYYGGFGHKRGIGLR